MELSIQQIATNLNHGFFKGSTFLFTRQFPTTNRKHAVILTIVSFLMMLFVRLRVSVHVNYQPKGRVNFKEPNQDKAINNQVYINLQDFKIMK